MIADRFDLLVGEKILHRLVVKTLGDGVKRQGEQLKPHHIRHIQTFRSGLQTPTGMVAVEDRSHGVQLPGQG